MLAKKVLKVVKVAKPEPQVRLDDCLDAANDDDELALKDYHIQEMERNCAQT